MREEDLQRCLEIQALTGSSRPLGQILVEEGVITTEMLDELLGIQGARRTQTVPQALVPGQDLGRFLQAAVAQGASDLYVSEGSPVMARVAGVLQKMTAEPIAPPEVWAFVRNLLGENALDLIAEHRTLHSDFQRESLTRGRICAFRHSEGVGVAIRLHPEHVRPPADTGVPKGFFAALEANKGLVLVAGESRSGISETLATVVHEVSREKNRIVLVLDAVMEHPLPVDGAVVIRRRVGEHTKSYATGLQAAMHEAPDVIVVGDLSDPEAFDLALHAAESGRLVVGAVRARSAVLALQRCLVPYPAQDLPRMRTMLASLLRAVLAVQLVPDKTKTSMLLATELLLVSDAAREVMREGNLSQMNLLVRLNSEFGQSMDSSLIRLVKSGKVKFEDVFHRAEDKALVMQAIRGKPAAPPANVLAVGVAPAPTKGA